MEKPSLKVHKVIIFCILCLYRNKKKQISRNFLEFEVKNLDGFEEGRKSYLEPKAQLNTALKLAPYINSMIDVSDGLAPEIKHICDESKCGAIIYKDKIPIKDELRKVARVLGENEYDYALFGGEDFKLVFTISKDNLDRVDGFLIGEITKNREIKLQSHNEEKIITNGGYDHFTQDL